MASSQLDLPFWFSFVLANLICWYLIYFFWFWFDSDKLLIFQILFFQIFAEFFQIWRPDRIALAVIARICWINDLQIFQPAPSIDATARWFQMNSRIEFGIYRSFFQFGDGQWFGIRQQLSDLSAFWRQQHRPAAAASQLALPVPTIIWAVISFFFLAMVKFRFRFERFWISKQQSCWLFCCPSRIFKFLFELPIEFAVYWMDLIFFLHFDLILDLIWFVLLYSWQPAAHALVAAVICHILDRAVNSTNFAICPWRLPATALYPVPSNKSTDTIPANHSITNHSGSQ